MTFEQTKWVWMNGEFAPWADANIHVSVHGLHYGSGVFEGIRSYQTNNGPSIFRLDAHLRRLYESAAVYGMEIPYTSDDLTEAICELIKRNDFESCYIRPICFFGSDGLGLYPRTCPVQVIIFAWPWATYLGEEGLKNGIRVTISPWQKFNSAMMPTTAKACGQYLNSILAVRDAITRGFDEALLLDRNGHIAEGSGENLFLVRKGKILTNDERHSILLGITRDSVIQIAQDLGYVVEIGAIELAELIAADEAFFTGTAAEVTPIIEVDGQRIGKGRRGPVTEQLQNVFFGATQGKEDKFKHWLHTVYDTILDEVSSTAR